LKITDKRCLHIFQRRHTICIQLILISTSI